MLDGLRQRITYANAAATVAVFIALGGGAYAASALPRASVGPEQLRADAVSSGKVADHSLLARDFRRGQLKPGARGPQGPAGPPGPAGPRGLTGASGPGAVSLDGQVELDVNQAIFESAGIRVRVVCSATSGGGYALALVQPIGTADDFYAWGTRALDGAAPQTVAVQPPAGGLSGYVAAQGVAAASLDVTAEGTPSGAAVRWVAVHALVVRGSRCNYHALIIPPA